VTRPFSNDGAAAATQAVTSGAGRGIGTAAALKLASICVGSAALTTGAVCITLQSPAGPDRSPPRSPQTAPVRTPAPPSRSGPSREPKRPLPTATPSPRPRRHPAKPKTPAPSSTSQPRAHETAVAVSPAAASAAPDGTDEFGPTSAPASNVPAAPPTTGGAEFP